MFPLLRFCTAIEDEEEKSKENEPQVEQVDFSAWKRRMLEEAAAE